MAPDARTTVAQAKTGALDVTERLPSDTAAPSPRIAATSLSCRKPSGGTSRSVLPRMRLPSDSPTETRAPAGPGFRKPAFVRTSPSREASAARACRPWPPPKGCTAGLA